MLKKLQALFRRKKPEPKTQPAARTGYVASHTPPPASRDDSADLTNPLNPLSPLSPYNAPSWSYDSSPSNDCGTSSSFSGASSSDCSSSSDSSSSCSCDSSSSW